MKKTAQFSPWNTRRDREKEREIKREAVLRAAAQAFNENGFHATSLDDIAEHLGVTKPTLYYYFKNKDEILFECVRVGLGMLKQAISDIDTPDSTVLDKLIAAMRKYAEIITMDFGMCLVRVGEDPLPPESRKKLRRLKAGIDREFRNLIQQGIDKGVLAPVDAKIAAFTIAGALSWIGKWYRPDGPLSPEEIADQCIAVLMNGVARQPIQSATKAKARTKAKV
jgi:AcrR family transcriptional regulator